MKSIKWSATFRKHYKERITKDERLQKAFWDTIDGFLYNRQWVGDHSLQEKMAGKSSFDVTDEYRIVYIEREDNFLFLDVGTHEEVYIR